MFCEGHFELKNEIREMRAEQREYQKESSANIQEILEYINQQKGEKKIIDKTSSKSERRLTVLLSTVMSGIIALIIKKL